MNNYDQFTNLLKKIQEKDIQVYIEEYGSTYKVKSRDRIFIHDFDSREKAVNFCRYLELPIIAYVRRK